ncbi:18940_t:CDS:1, partial [Gigaspora margarita]
RTPIKRKVNFPIKDKDEAWSFIEQIPHYYRILTPLPETYIEINYTNLSNLLLLEKE